MVDCKKRSSIGIQKKNFETLKAKSDLFFVPVINGSVTRELFERNAQIKPMPIDMSIIQDAFESVEHDESKNGTEPSMSNAVECLRSESERQIRTRNSSRMSSIAPVSVDQSGISTPQSRQSIRCSTPIPNVNVSLRGTSSFLDMFDQVFTPPQKFKNSQNSPSPIDFDNNIQSDFELPLERQTLPNENADVSEHQRFECPDLIESFGENSMEYQLMSKLVNLWHINKHPIKVESLLTPNSNRFRAAKTFSSLLSE